MNDQVWQWRSIRAVCVGGEVVREGLGWGQRSRGSVGEGGGSVGYTERLSERCEDAVADV